MEYARGRGIDLYGDGDARPIILMWHGAQTDARHAMRPLAESVAAHGFTVLVPDWNSHADDGGRGDLLGSVDFARQRAGSDGVVLVGWSLGGVAAAGLTIHAARFDVRVAHTVCLAGAFVAREPITAAPLPTELPRQPSPFTLVHGVDDDVVPIEASRSFAATLRDNAWPVEVAELAADHATIAGATYDPALDRYSAADDPKALAVANDVAARIAAAVQ
ncbi:MAG TPA: alpha/beta fold hydrolase [Mycobacterium sp.]|nr:alpha/beta fold hydrolase [Mycobacterium sp.]